MSHSRREEPWRGGMIHKELRELRNPRTSALTRRKRGGVGVLGSDDGAWPPSHPRVAKAGAVSRNGPSRSLGFWPLPPPSLPCLGT